MDGAVHTKPVKSKRISCSLIFLVFAFKNNINNLASTSRLTSYFLLHFLHTFTFSLTSLCSIATGDRELFDVGNSARSKSDTKAQRVCAWGGGVWVCGAKFLWERKERVTPLLQWLTFPASPSRNHPHIQRGWDHSWWDHPYPIFPSHFVSVHLSFYIFKCMTKPNKHIDKWNIYFQLFLKLKEKQGSYIKVL